MLTPKRQRRPCVPDGEQNILRYSPGGPTLERFFASNARRRCLLGPFGSGKSAANCQEIIRRAKHQAPDAQGVRKTRWAVVRNTYGELKQTTVRTWQDWWGPQFGSFTNQSPFEHKVRFGLRDGTKVECDVIFLAMDDEADAKKFLSLEVTGIFFNEVREIRQSIVNAADGRIGRFPKTVRRDGKVVFGPTWYGIIADTNMPDEDHWLHELYQSPDNGGWEFFRQPGGVVKNDNGEWVETPDAENLNNLPTGYYVNQLAGKSEEWVSVYLASEFGRIPDEGAYFTDEMKRAEKEGRIANILHDPALAVHTFWDLGIDDYMAIWFGQGVSGQWRWIDYYENTGKALGHYAKIVAEKARERDFTYGKDIWPHDGATRLDGKGENPERRCDIWEDLTGRLPVVLDRPKPNSFGDELEAMRKLIAVSLFDRTHCYEGLKHLRRYSREFDSARNVFKREANHDDHSHGADAFRAAATGRQKCTNDVWKGDYNKYSQGMAVV